jgi:hypothetical protein
VAGNAVFVGHGFEVLNSLAVSMYVV